MHALGIDRFQRHLVEVSALGVDRAAAGEGLAGIRGRVAVSSRTSVPRYVRSSTFAVGAFAITDLMPFSIPEGDLYISLFPIVSPFFALITK